MGKNKTRVDASRLVAIGSLVIGTIAMILGLIRYLDSSEPPLGNVQKLDGTSENKTSGDNSPIISNTGGGDVNVQY